MRKRRVVNIARFRADVIATGTIGCAKQIGLRTQTPVAHSIEPIDWASGGPAPQALSHLAGTMPPRQ